MLPLVELNDFSYVRGNKQGETRPPLCLAGRDPKYLDTAENFPIAKRRYLLRQVARVRSVRWEPGRNAKRSQRFMASGSLVFQ